MITNTQVAAALGLCAVLASSVADAAPAAPSPSIYVQLLGGLAAPLDVNFVSNSDLEPTSTGGALAATVGVVVMPGVSVEGDFLYTRRAYPPSGLNGDNTTMSLMGNAKFTMPVGSGFNIYGAAGVGFIKMVSTESGTAYPYDVGAGYQLIAGAEAAVAENLSLVGEVRFQNTFKPYTDVGLGFADHVSAPTFTALVGVKAGF